MTTTADHGSLTSIPGYVAGTWTIDPVHSEVGFTARHMMVSKVRGRFRAFSGQVVTGTSPLDSSVDTGNDQRDAHIRSADFFEVETYPVMTFRSTGIHTDDDVYILEGKLTLKGVTKDVSLALELNGFGPDAYGGTRAGFTAIGEINRRDFGVNFGAVMETGGAVVSDKITIQLEIEAVLQS